MNTPVHKRNYITFLSHAHADKAIVDSLEYWLNDICGLSVWYDSKHLPVSAKIVSHLSSAIADSKSITIVLSESSIQSGWVREEYDAAIAHRADNPDYKIIPIRIDKCDIPGFLQTTKWIQLEDGKITRDTAFEILYSLYYSGSFRDLNNIRDVYVARSWRSSESKTANSVCQSLIRHNYRLIGDAKDQEGFDPETRIRSLVQSCGALVAILPNRGNGQTSKYIVDEINIAKSLNLPVLCITEDGLEVEKYDINNPIKVTKSDSVEEKLDMELESFAERWRKPENPHFVFYARSIDENDNQKNKYIESLIETITGIQCTFGDQIYSGEIQSTIATNIKNSLVVLADISDHNLNTCIEVGIARGANRSFHLVSKKPRTRPPFMFRDQQVWFYENDVELLGIIHRIMLPYKRRVMNYELVVKRTWC